MGRNNFRVRSAIVGLLLAGTTGVGLVATAGTAAACGAMGERSDAVAASLPQVLPGQQGTYVMGLQKALRKEGYRLEGTGYYGNNTLAAVKDFQRKHGIKASGIVGSKTWHKLVGSMNPNLTHNVGAGERTGITPGETSLEVRLLVDALDRIYPYSARISGEEQSANAMTYGVKYQGMVKDFQRRNGIKDSGIVGPKTWAALDRVITISGGWGC